MEAMGTGPEPAGRATIEDLESLLANLEAVGDDALREEEFAETQRMLDDLKGKTIKRASVEAKRIVVETSDGNRYFFFGFMGGPSAQE
jgi:hypothetical protein